MKTRIPYSEVCAVTHYSFLKGASHPSEMVETAAQLGLSALGITDLNGVYALPKAYAAWKNLASSHPKKLKLISGVELKVNLQGLRASGMGPSFLGEDLRIRWLAKNRLGYGLLCRMITEAHAGKEKGSAFLTAQQWIQFLSHPRLNEAKKGLICILDPRVGQFSKEPEFLNFFDFIHEDFFRQIYIPVSRTGRRVDRSLEEQARFFSQKMGIPILATQFPLHHQPSRQPLQDVLTSIRERASVFELGERLQSNAENTLKGPEYMNELFSDFPEALIASMEVAQQCDFSLSELRYRYPSEWIPPGESAISFLRSLTQKGAHLRYSGRIPLEVKRQLEHELKLIESLNFSDYFLTIWDIVDFARKRKILCQGRGSAANSAVCYCLGITAVDPVRMNLLFERFISAERGEPPDIDVDFEHERREEVIQYVYEKYGRDRAGMVSAIITYRTRSALRDVAFALDLTPEETQKHPVALQLMEQLKGFPRHLGIHSGGFTLSADPLIETVPIEPARMEGRTIVQWDKEDLAVVGLLKVDLLALGMLSALRKCLDQIQIPLHQLPAEDKKTYEMIGRGDTVGVFQIESRAQMGMLKRLQPQTYYDLVIQVAIVRPGPIVGEMVHPYLRRRRGEERVEYPHPKLIPILGRTLGVPLFQEQVMKMAMELAGFTPGEADELRRAIGAWRSTGSVQKVAHRLGQGLLASGLPEEFVNRIFKQIQGFSEYGFPESHAASFALIAYASSYLKCHYPAEFCWALLNSLPMGFYSAHTLIEDVQRHGVKVFPVDVQCSQKEHRLEKNGIRLGFSIVRGMGDAEIRRLVETRESCGPFLSLGDLITRAQLGIRALQSLAMGGAFEVFGYSQRDALWSILEIRNSLATEEEKKKNGEQFDFFSHLGEAPKQERVSLFPVMKRWQVAQSDFKSFGVTLRGHPLSILRAHLTPTARKFSSLELNASSSGRRVTLAGMVICRQRPPTAKGTAFATLEDEHGFIDLILHERVFEKYRDVFLSHSFFEVTGQTQRDRGSASLLVQSLRAIELDSELGPSAWEGGCYL